MTTVTTNENWIVAVYGKDPGAVAAAYYETRRHLTTEFESPIRVSSDGGGMFLQVRMGRPYRAWTTQELMGTIAMMPVVKLATGMGRPVFIEVKRAPSNFTPDLLWHNAEGMIDASARAASSVVSAATRKAEEIAAGAGLVVGGFALANLLIPLGVLVLLYVFRKPLLKLAKDFL